MGRSEKSRRVTWAADVNLCQVRLFLSEESPSEVGMGTQDHLQAKTLWSVQSRVTGSDDNLPPGFEGIQSDNAWRAKLSQIPLTNWICPLRFEVNADWQVVSGEESPESEVENRRELRVLEAIYPRPSAIPPNPSELVGVEESSNNDQFAPTIPITPIEDEDTATDTAGNSIPMASQSSLASTASVAPDIVAVARAALTSVMSKNDHENLIDSELLIKILSDPKSIEQLVTNHTASSSILPGAPAVGIQTAASSSASSMLNTPSTTSSQFGPSFSVGANRIDPLSTQIPKYEPGPPYGASSNGPFYSPSHIGTVPNVRPNAAKDINYYKNLIQQHGGERRDAMPQYVSQELPHIPKPREPKRKITKPCIYFNTPRGCRNGANCPFQHDLLPSQPQRVSNIPEVQTVKRVKLDREITGT